ncbi:hypothetical protein [Xenorhabdus innexi]|uniref:Polyketide cyclase n=1 Tax=Xenorhabdus innexi TaxID=290109 RepID=A0A1N6MX32_9GAMM|nr:hypothetical protein [Xenorhabdus innexi]PHM30345.1 hypothetical protein Xinn_03319 [Xenorhabdus innexi]SIP73425.1 conserved hypothetical protein [Xenorhabdus innexi]
MLVLSFSTPVNADPSHIWAHYVDFELRKKWEVDLESFQFEGEVKTGQYGRMVLNGMPEIRFYLSHIEINKEFTDQVSLPQIGTLTFSHQIIPDESNVEHQIKVTVSLNPDVNVPAIQAQNFFKQVTHDLVETVLRLKAVVE